MKKPDLFQYRDYRKYLKDFALYLERAKSISLRQWAVELQVSVSLLSMIINGKRNISAALIEKVLSQAKLSESHRKYFYCIVELSDTQDPEKRVLALNGMKRLMGFRKASQNEFEAFEYLTHWLYVVLREATFMDDFQWNAEWIRERFWPEISKTDVQKAMRFLANKGYVEIVDNKVTAKERQINCDSDIYRLSLAQFHSEMFERGIESIEKVKHEHRMIVGHTLSLSTSARNEIHELLTRTQEKIREIEDRDLGAKTQVYHVGLASFPLTKQTEGDK